MRARLTAYSLAGARNFLSDMTRIALCDAVGCAYFVCGRAYSAARTSGALRPLARAAIGAGGEIGLARCGRSDAQASLR